MIKIPIHSCTDLITNSSTVIFTYSESAEPAMVEMINEVFRTFGIDKKCEDVFDTVVLTESYRYSESDHVPEGMSSEEVDKLVEDVATCKVPKPEWFKEVEGKEDSWSYYTPDTHLHIIPKKEEYRQLAGLINTFLYSTDHEATRDG